MWQNCTSSTLTEARLKKCYKYIGTCSIHGAVPFTTKDNACCTCQTQGALKRRTKNYQYNRTREKFNEIKRRAAAQQLEFDITLSELREMMEATTHCPYLGIELNDDAPSTQYDFDRQRSVDRIDPLSGYTFGNVVVCSNRANRIKSDATADELHRIAGAIPQVCDMVASRQRDTNNPRRIVVQLDMSGVEVAQFDNAQQAADATGLSASSIRDTCRLKQRSHPRNIWVWKYKRP